MKIVEYTTVNDTKVNEYLKDGWQPYGSPVLSDINGEIIQPMVKYEASPVPKYQGQWTHDYEEARKKGWLFVPLSEEPQPIIVRKGEKIEIIDGQGKTEDNNAQ